MHLKNCFVLLLPPLELRGGPKRHVKIGDPFELIVIQSAEFSKHIKIAQILPCVVFVRHRNKVQQSDHRRGDDSKFPRKEEAQDDRNNFDVL